MHLAHLLSSFLILSKIEGIFLVTQILVYCLNVAFISSMLWTTKLRFQFWEKREVRRRSQKEQYQENMADKVGLQIHIQSQQSLQLVTCRQERCPARAEHRKSVFHATFLRFPGVAASTSLHIMHLLSCDFAQDNQS